jgi:hypothetical protein
MALRWVSRGEVKVVNQLLARRTELAEGQAALNPGSHLWPGIYWLVDARPVGGWKGNEWAILWTDFSDSMAKWYPTKDHANANWQEILSEAAKQSV